MFFVITKLNLKVNKILSNCVNVGVGTVRVHNNSMMKSWNQSSNKSKTSFI